MHPQTRANFIDEQGWEQIFQNMKKVLQKAIECDDDIKSLPQSYLLPHRHKGGKCPEGEKLKTIKVGGRTTFLCPHQQMINDDTG